MTRPVRHLHKLQFDRLAGLVARGLIEVSRYALPENLFAIDGRVQKARELLVRIERREMRRQRRLRRRLQREFDPKAGWK